MNKKCGRCEKTVYPTEELNCLDKVWHKLCFKCQECGMTLNMRNYKGYNKLPYCEAHIPKAKATTVAETPELRRIAENTRIQSNIKYHEEFEKSKGKFTQVADDPETLRIKANTKIISNVMYHGELERKEEMEKKRSLQSDDPVHPPQVHHLSQQVYTSQPSQTQNYNKPVERNSYSHPKKEHNDSPYSARQASTLIYSSQIGSVSSVPGRKIGSIADYDPLGDYNSNGNDLSPRDSRSQMYPGYIQEPPRAMNHNNNPYQPTGIGRVYRAMYDYQAADSDEVSFRDGDVIINCTPIDEGWMTGTVQRSGHTGMLPANYVEPVN